MVHNKLGVRLILDKNGQVTECGREWLGVTLFYVQLRFDDVDKFADLEEVRLFHRFDVVLEEFLVVDRWVAQNAWINLYLPPVKWVVLRLLHLHLGLHLQHNFANVFIFKLFFGEVLHDFEHVCLEEPEN